MMPPRLQCLNAVRQLGAPITSYKAAFSTSATTRLERSSNATSLLSGLEDSPSGSDYLASRIRSNASVDRRARQGVRPAPNQAAHERVARMVGIASKQRSRLEAGGINNGRSTAEEVEKHARSKDLSKMITRRWKTGDIYAPHDLSPVEMKKWKRRGRPEADCFDTLAMDPIDEYKNFSIMSEFMTPMGRIKHSLETGLRPRNQRKIAKAIRRSIGLGLMPSVHKHPEILQMEVRRRNEQHSRTFF